MERYELLEEVFIIKTIDRHELEKFLDRHPEYKHFEELLLLLPGFQKVARQSLLRELDLQHDEEKIEEERRKFKEIASLIQGKWFIDILHVIAVSGELFFNDLKNSLPAISARILTDRLRYLEEKRIIIRNEHESLPVKRVSYVLTPFGEGLAGLLLAIYLYYLIQDNP